MKLKEGIEFFDKKNRNIYFECINFLNTSFLKKKKMINVLLRLLTLMKPMAPFMLFTISAGVIGFLCIIFIPIIGLSSILNLLHLQDLVDYKLAPRIIIICALTRSILKYLEQFVSHHIAFKTLGLIRDQVFKSLRRLSPAKLERKDKGNLISIITTDIDQLETFYAYTIGPMAVNIITSLILTCFMAYFNIPLALISLTGYFTVGFALPFMISKCSYNRGRDFRNKFGNMNSYLLDNLRGLRETIQFNNGESRIDILNSYVDSLANDELAIKLQNGFTQGVMYSAVLLYSLIILTTGIYLNNKEMISFESFVMILIAFMGSFNSITQLSSMTGNLNNVVASGERILAIVDEDPQVQENLDGKLFSKNDDIEIEMKNVSFSYSNEIILDDLNAHFEKNKFIGISGKSGSGKTSLLRLIMRFWDVKKGSISLNDQDVRNINTSSLRDVESYVTQETSLFNDSIEENIKVAKLNATHEEVVEAAKKASIHEFIESLPEGYNTNVGELGDRLSGGERQRIGIARAFLHDSNLILLDEPTSNLDSLNEAIILKSINQARKDKAIVLVSHRLSTMSAADRIYSVENGRLC